MDLLYFHFVPTLLFFGVFFFTWRGSEKAYKIIKETNSLGEEKFEVWFQYESMDCSSRNWCKQERFDTVKEAEDFIARQSKKREVVKEGTFKL